MQRQVETIEKQKDRHFEETQREQEQWRFEKETLLEENLKLRNEIVISAERC